METAGINNDFTPPELCVYSGDWDLYQEVLYEIFKRTLLTDNLFFQGLPVRIKRHPEYKERHFAFWHLISEGEKEDERTPDFRRCERLAWVRFVVEKSENHAGIFWWLNKRGSETHAVIWFEKENYAVILAKRQGYFLLKTAYLLEKRRALKFAEERTQFYKKKS